VRPETVGLLTHLSRHGRGMINALEAYAHKMRDQKLSPLEIQQERTAIALFARAALEVIDGLLIDAGADGASVGSDHPPGVSPAGRSRPPGARRPGL
jgi:hypothetical protein